MPIDEFKFHASRYLGAILNIPPAEAWHRPFIFHTYPDAKPKDPSLITTQHGCLANLAPRLIALNERGAGVFVQYNPTDSLGTSKSNVLGYRGWHADLDDKAAVTQLDRNRLPLLPTLIISTGHGIHLYWLSWLEILRRIGVLPHAEHEAELRGIQRALAIYGADSSVAEAARRMRLPGTYNNKDGFGHRLLVTLDLVTQHRYTRDQIAAAFPPHRREEARQTVPQAHFHTCDELTLRRARAYLKKIPLAIEGQHGRDRAFEAAMKMMSYFGLDAETVCQLMSEEYNPACIPPFSAAELKQRVDGAKEIARPMLLPPRPFTPGRRR